MKSLQSVPAIKGDVPGAVAPGHALRAPLNRRAIKSFSLRLLAMACCGSP